MTQKKLKVVTTSWDDGDARDLKIAEMLRLRGMTGTFYVPIEPFSSDPSLTTKNMRELTAEGFEIGGHGIAHEIMSQIPIAKVKQVVNSCKATLEEKIGQRVRMFCYPRGKFTAEVAQELKKAGYDGARTVRLLATDTRYDLYDLPTSIQVYPHTRSEYLRNVVKARKADRLYSYMTTLGFDDDWVAIGKKLFDRVLAEGGMWHLWGHSWEIDQLKQWGPMAEMLDYVSGRDGVMYMNNGDLANHLAANPN
jgi:peptidoglycan/xylan/chitin deacetylase (PgdA/CDA1 family)